MSIRGDENYPSFDFVAAKARPRTLLNKIRKKPTDFKEKLEADFNIKVARPADPPEITIDLIMYKAGVGPYPKPKPLAEPGTETPEPEPEEGNDAIPTTWHAQHCASPSTHPHEDAPDPDGLVEEVAARHAEAAKSTPSKNSPSSCTSPTPSTDSATASAPDSPIRFLRQLIASAGLQRPGAFTRQPPPRKF